LRGLAIVMTAVAHINLAMPITPAWLLKVYGVSEYWGGVYLFFVISGFVISRGFSDAFEKDTLRAWREFYIRRFFRIMPPALFWISATLLIAFTFNSHSVFGDFSNNAVQAAAASILTYNFVFARWTATFSIYWSLSLEEQFYLVFPATHFLARRWRYFLLGLIIAALFFVRRPAGTFSVFLPVDALAWGVLVAAAHRTGVAKLPTLLIDPRWRLVNQVGCVAAIILIPSWLKPLTPCTSLMTLVCAWVVYCASFDQKSMEIGGKWFRIVGIVSFSAYLCHTTCLLLSKEAALWFGQYDGAALAMQNLFATVLAVTLATICSFMSYHYIERPCREYGAALARQVLPKNARAS
jgi:peptidoglycan/LPS O-acetylase OafA/YrhL